MILFAAIVGCEAEQTNPREAFNGYLAFPDTPAEMQARIDERDLHGATQAYLWSMSTATMFAWEEANLMVGNYHDLVTFITPEDKRDISSRHDIHVNDDGTTPVYISSDCGGMSHPQNCVDSQGQGDIFLYFRLYAPTQDYFDKNWVLPDIRRIK